MKKVHDSETPAEGQQKITACAFIVEEINGEQRLFLPRRAKTKKFLPDKFELPGGHIDFGEELEAGLKREIHEEFGVDIEVGHPFHAFTYINEVKGSHSVEIIYFARLNDDIEMIKLNPEDHSEARWVSRADYEKLVNAQIIPKDTEYKGVMQGFNNLDNA